MYPSVVVLGNIAAGKTTAASLLAEQLDVPSYLEDVSSNPFLPRLETDPARWCFANQVWFTHEAFFSRYDAVRGGVFDHSVEELIPIHSPVFHRYGWLDDQEWQLLRDLGDSLAPLLRPPDLYLVLENDAQTSIARVRDRNRGADRQPEAGYLADVNASRALFLESCNTPVLRLNSDEVDFRDRAGRLYLIEAVTRALV